MAENKEGNFINISYSISNLIIISSIIVFIWIIGVSLYDLILTSLRPHALLSMAFLIFSVLNLDRILHLANAKIDETHIYLKGLFFSKKIELSTVISLKQKNRIKWYHEKMIEVKIRGNTWRIKRFYIIPNNLSYETKPTNKIFDFLNEYTEKAKNKNAR